MPLVGSYKRPLSTMPYQEFRQWLEANWPANFYNWQYASDRTKIDGTTIATGTVTADYVVASVSITSPTITGGTFQTHAAADAGIKIDGTSLRGYAGGVEVVTLTTAGVFTMTGGTITGATIQTSALATTGIKLTGTSLIAYDGGGNADFSIGADGIVTCQEITMTTEAYHTHVLSGDIRVQEGDHGVTVDYTGISCDAQTDISYKVGNVDVINYLKAFVGTGGVSTSGTINTTDVYKVDSVQVIGNRITGWSAPTGTGSRAALASHAAQTITNPPTAAEVQNIDNSLVATSQALHQLIEDLTTHGAIGPTP